MKKIFILTLFTLSVMCARAQTKLTLRDAINTGIKNNLLLQQNGLQVERESVASKQAKLNRLPDLNASVRHGFNQGRSIDPFTNSYVNESVNFSSYGIGSGVVLFNGFSMKNRVHQTDLAHKASQMELQQSKDNLTIDIILAYLQVLSSEEILNQSKSQEELSRQQVVRLETLHKEGAIAPPQLSDLRGQYANDQLAIINAQNALEASRILLSQLMNVPYDKNIQLEKITAESFATRYGVTIEEVYNLSASQFALIKAADLRRQSAEKAVKAIKGELFPTLSLNAGLNTNYSSAAMQSVLLSSTFVPTNDYVIVNGAPSPVFSESGTFKSNRIAYGRQLDNNLFTSVSVDLQIPIFNGLFTRNRIKLAKIELKNTELIAQTVKTQLRQDIELAYVNMNSAYDRYKALLEQMIAYEESFRAAEIRFNEGVGNSIEYLTAKNNLERANINLISARYDYVLRTKILDYYQGKPMF